MKPVKNVIIYIVTALILVGCVILPPYFSELGDKKILNRVTTIENDATLTAYSYTLTLEERLSLFSESREGSRVLSQYVEIADYSEIHSALDLLEPEVRQLQELGLFPSFVEPDFTGTSSYLGLITSYSLYDPYTSATYREMTAGDLNNSNFTCLFLQDTESGKIIEFSISGYSMLSSDTKSFLSNIDPDTMGEYLGIDTVHFEVSTSSTDSESFGTYSQLYQRRRFGTVSYVFELYSDALNEELSGMITDGYYFYYRVGIV